MTTTTSWLAEEYIQVNANQVRTALIALEMAGGALAPGAAVADVGCGTGEVARALGDRGLEVWASDASPSMVEATARRCVGLDVRAEVCPAERLELPPRYFTVVHCSWVLHWLTEVEEPLHRLARALRPGGSLVLQWTGAQPRSEGGGQYGILREVAAQPRWRDHFAAAPLAMHSYPADEIAAVLTGAGLEITHFEPDLVHPTSVAKGTAPTAADLAEVRRRMKLTGFAAQTAALGDLIDDYIDEALRRMVEAGETNPRDARVIARRPAETTGGQDGAVAGGPPDVP